MGGGGFFSYSRANPQVGRREPKPGKRLVLVGCSRGLGAVGGGECVKKRGGGLCNEAERREKLIFFLAFKSRKKLG